MEFVDLLLKLLLSLGLGGLIGIEREKTHKGYPAGIRTLALISLFGMLTSFITNLINNSWVMIVSIIIAFLVTAISYYVGIKNKRSFGLTNTVVILITFFIGLISYFEQYQYIAIAISIITTLILSEKKKLHSFVRNLKHKELEDALKFGIIAFVILPLLPNQTIDSLGVINPYNLWLMVVLILSISFAGYIASKFVGTNKGIYLSGILGGLVSSTAVSSSLSITSKKDKRLLNACITGITIASSIMFLRVLIEAFIINPQLGQQLLFPFSLSFLIGLLTSLYYLRKKKVNAKEDLVTSSPFNILPALKFTLLLAIILIVSKLAITYLGDRGLYITSVFAGLVDTDAITLSTSTLVNEGQVGLDIGANVVMLACLTNTLVKLGITRLSGSKKLFRKMLINYVLIISPLIIFLIF